MTGPIGQDRKFALVDLSVQLGDEWEIHARQKLDVRGIIRVFLATGDLQTVNAVLVYGLGMVLASRKLYNVPTYMSRSDDCPVPVAHHDIVRVIEAIRT